jgi:hypothetical protein
MKPTDVCKNELENRIGQIELCLKSAKNCLNDGDYLQCAVRLEMVTEFGKFSDFDMDIMDGLTEKE